ncbi:SDR family oxidoreductase [Rhizobium sp. AG207R]|uniref:SDR family oxidoreductase n=1 Tax=Rhizobium sp. AG207R TaxID=2802287 RepID=UPI0022ABE285|nr:SDR family oxidoreductase [Rhizobium sp. AG207R]MCZ3374363.1 SDR family oxidoreductase [Rhizobium sp. AG207R]
MTIEIRTAIVTGAAQGIGRGIAERLAQDGLAVTLADLPSNKEALETAAAGIKAAGSKCRIAEVDVTLAPDVERMVKEHVTAFGGIDVMVANAGIAVTALFEDTTVEIVDRTMAINVRGVFNCYKAAATQMIKQGRGGRLIAAGSVSAHKGGEWQCAYVASKFAVRGFNQTVALELAKYGITANIYSPGVIMTSMWDSIDKVVTAKEGKPRGSQTDKMLPNIPLGRTGTPQDVARVVSFLASESAAYVTGQSVIVDGGMYMA